MSERDDILEQLSAWVDGELPPDQARRVEQAVREDPVLAEEADALRKLRRLVRSVPVSRAPEGFASRVLARAERAHLLGQPQGNISRSFRWISLATAAVVLLAAGAAMFIIFRMMQEPPQSTPIASAPKSNQPAAERTPGKRGVTAVPPAVAAKPTAEEIKPKPPKTAPGPVLAMNKNERTRDGEIGIEGEATGGGAVRKDGKAQETARSGEPASPAAPPGVTAKAGRQEQPPAGTANALEVPGPAVAMKTMKPSAADAVAPAEQKLRNRLVLQADDLAKAQREVEKVLEGNGVTVAKASQDPLAERVVKADQQETRIVAHLTAQQMAKVKSDLDRLQRRLAPSVELKDESEPVSDAGPAVREMKVAGAAIEPSAQPAPAAPAALTRPARPLAATGMKEESPAEAGKLLAAAGAARRAGPTDADKTATQPVQAEKKPASPEDVKVAAVAPAEALQPAATQRAVLQTRPAGSDKGDEEVIRQASAKLQPLVISLRQVKAKAAVVADRPETQPARSSQAPTTQPAGPKSN